LNSILLNCNDWEDYLWARIKSSIEYKKNHEISIYVSEYKEIVNSVLKELKSNDLDLKDIISSLVNSGNEYIKKEAFEPYHIIQSKIILNHFSDLILLLFNLLKNINVLVQNKLKIKEEKEENKSVSVGLIRFSCHLILYLENYDIQSFDSEKKDLIIQKYIECLIELKQVLYLLKKE
jgi:hypothetical protein